MTDIYEVNDIIDHHTKGSCHEFRIQWKGYTAKDDTWEDESHVNANELLDQYWASHPVDEAEVASS